MSRLKVTIRDEEGEEGAIVYRPSSQTILVSHPNKIVRQLVTQYLTAVRGFKEPIPDAPMLSTQTVDGKPTDSLHRMYYALNEMNFQIGVMPIWNDIDNQLLGTGSDEEDDLNKGLYINI